MSVSIIKNTDSYKWSHFLFYPEGTQYVESYLESRGGKYPATVFFGLQFIVDDYLSKPITMADILEAEAFAKKHGVPFNKEGWLHILTEHEGYLPLIIKAVPEGTLVTTKNVLCTVRNTDPKCAWLTSYVETLLLRIWYTCTVATRIFYMKQKMKPYFDATSDSGNMDFALLDFSARGCSSYESNQLGGAAYLMLFMGSDSVAAVDFVNTHYGEDMVGFSVPATEHSIMCAYGHENEFESFKRILEQAPEGGIVSVVSDTWNIYEACTMWTELADLVRKRNLTLVVRPDSGEMKDVLPRVLDILDEGFGSTVNSKGYGVLDNVKVLWGDGINEDTCTDPFAIAETMGISADSIIVGSGGGLMQSNIDRDTCKFAFKASAVCINGEWKGIAKDPITDPGKQSKQGLLDLLYDEDLDYYFTIDRLTESYPQSTAFGIYYEDGQTTFQDWADIKERVNSYL